MKRYLPVLFVVAFPPFASGQAKETPPAVKGNDPVELVAGKEVPGDAARTVVHGRFTYRFATDANKAAFQKEPEKYCVQFDGACMKMGPPAGGSNTDRWAVYDSRIYVFASEGCRNVFRAAPENYVDKADEKPTGTEVQKKAAAGLLDKAVAAVGGAKKLREAKSYQITIRYDGKSGEQAYTYHRYFGVTFGGATVFRETYDKSFYGWVLTPTEAVYTKPAGWDVMSGQVREFCTRDIYRHTICVLNAWTAGEATAVAIGPGHVGEVVVERVTVHVKGATTTFGIDPQTGRILRATYRGRADGPIATVEQTFSDFRDVGGITVPFAVATSNNGKPVENPKATIESVMVNDPIPADYLKKPQ